MNEYGKEVKRKIDTYMNNEDSVDKEVSDIQNAMHGVEVRGALAAGVKKSFDKSKSAEGKSNEAYDITQNLLDGSFDSAALEANFGQRLDDEIKNLQPEWTQFKDQTNQQLAETATETQLGRVKVDGKSIVSNNEGVVSTKNNMQPVTAPVGFEWQDHPLVNKIFTDGLGNYFIRDFDLSKFKPLGNVYYVDPKNGDDSKDGLTLETAFRRFETALNKVDATVIKLAEGIHFRSSQQLTIDRDLSVEALDGHDVYFSNSQGPDFVHHEGNVFVAEGTTGGYMFLDPSRRDKNGDWVKYTQLTSLSQVENNPGSYAKINGNTYIHTYDSSIPKRDTNFVRLALFDNIRIEGSIRFYMKGIKLIGGETVFSAENTGVGSMEIFVEDCSFQYTSSAAHNVVWIKSADMCVFKNCSANDGLKDGFNYAQREGGVPTRAIEINCVAKRNGTEGSDGDQGSTQHQGGKIIRINGVYAGNHGANIADTHAGTQSWNLGCIAYNPLAASLNRRFNYHRLNGDMWVEGCLGYNVNGGENISAGVVESNNSFHN